MFELLFFIVLLSSAYLLGSSVEKRHYRNIETEEQQLQSIPHSNLKKIPATIKGTPHLVHSSVAISQDYFKSILASLANVFGGRITAYESLLDRARREAIIRLKKQAVALGANQIYNIRLETSNISGKSRASNIFSAEVLAYATAIVPLREEEANARSAHNQSEKL